MGSSLLEQHRLDVEKLQQQFLQNKAGHFSLKNHPHPSNITRPPSYKTSSQLDINRFNRILDITDTSIIVEPRVTMEQLAKATLARNVMVPVIPEFKGITVGGAIMGAGMESASHKFGLFSDSCLSLEVLLGNGTVVRASPQENSDLFYGIVGSYGSLGIILSAEFRVIPAKQSVRLHYIQCDTLQKASELLLHSKADFIEGLVFAKNDIVIIEGTLTTEPPNYFLNKSWSRWFYTHAKNVPNDETMPLFDYLFRHDRGAFWIGAYGTHWSSIPRYFFESRLHLPALAKLLPKFDPKEFKGPADPGFLYRFLWGWAMTSHRLYAWLHSNSEEWVSKHFAIQDCCIPADRFVDFTTKALDEIGIVPLWLCPTPGTKKPQILSPHYSQHDQLINVGVYGISPLGTPRDMVRKLEKWTEAAQGRKVLYSYSYYTPEEFWKIYPRPEYDNLRQKYFANPWIDIAQKVLSP
jgi:Delta24-sterol reductase